MQIGDFIYEEQVSEERRSPKSQMARDQAAFLRQYRLLGTSRGAGVTPAQCELAKAQMVGYSYLAVSASGKRYIKRVPPHAVEPHGENVAMDGPDVSPYQRPYLFATSIEECIPATGHASVARNAAGEGPLPKSEKGYFLRIAFKNLPYIVRSDVDQAAIATDLGDGLPDEGAGLRKGWLKSRYIHKKVTDRTRSITLPQALLYHVRENLETYDATREAKCPAMATGLPFIQPRQEIVYTWIGVPIEGIPFKAIEKCRGKTNNSRLVAETNPNGAIIPANRLLNINEEDSSYFDGYPPGTLLFDGYDYTPAYQGPGNRYYVDLSYKFLFQANRDPQTLEFRGWNSFPRVKDGQFRYAWVSTSNNVTPGFAPSYLSVPYAPNADFATLFRPDQT